MRSNDMYEIIKARNNGKLALHLHMPDHLPTALYGDIVRIKQVMINFCTNAVKYTDTGSVDIFLETERIDDNHCKLIFSVEDTGRGIKPEKIETIYDLAKLLNENTIKYELSNPYNINVRQLCKEKGWAIFCPWSGDDLEICGIIDANIDIYGGATLKFGNKGDFYLHDYNNYGNDNALYKRASEPLFVQISNAEGNDILSHALIVESIWDPEYDDIMWDIQTNSKNCATFNIIDDENESGSNVWARCLIIDMNYYIKK